jgi:hypothetical protein
MGHMSILRIYGFNLAVAFLLGCLCAAAVSFNTQAKRLAPPQAVVSACPRDDIELFEGSIIEFRLRTERAIVEEEQIRLSVEHHRNNDHQKSTNHSSATDSETLKTEIARILIRTEWGTEELAIVKMGDFWRTETDQPFSPLAEANQFTSAKIDASREHRSIKVWRCIATESQWWDFASQ